MKQVVGDLRSREERAECGQRLPGRLPRGRAVPVLGPGSRLLLRRQCRRHAERARRRRRGGRRAARVHEHGGHPRARARLGLPLGRRALLPRRPASVRLLQAVQVRGRARGAARHRRGAAGLARAADLPGRPRGSRAHADRQARPRLPERAHAGLCGHRLERGPRRRRGRRARAGSRARPHRAELHPGWGEPHPAAGAGRARGHHGAPGPVRQGAQSRWPWLWPPSPSWSRAGSCAGTRPCRWRRRGCRPPRCPSTSAGPGRSWAMRPGPPSRRSRPPPAGSPERAWSRESRLDRIRWPSGH